MSLADSDVIIDFLNRSGPAQPLLQREIEDGTLFVSTVSLFEVLSGARTADEEHNVRRFFEVAWTVNVDQRAAVRAAEIDRYLRERGERLATGDTLIAGVALARGLPLMTRNRRHFERIPGLELVSLE